MGITESFPCTINREGWNNWENMKKKKNENIGDKRFVK